MIGALARFLLLRVLPRRLVPLFTVVEVVQLLRAYRRRRSRSARAQPAGTSSQQRLRQPWQPPPGRPPARPR